MALKGTLEDFGIAEILQLIGQQAKSGVLHLESRDDVIHISMADGNVVRAESAGRKAREKLGTLLVRADLITEQELAEGLDIQKRTLRRLGDILVEQGAVSVADLREMTALQTTETVYKLFHWKSGTYAFEPGDVEWDPETVSPLRAESVLMEGFRQVDEWPLVRKRITSLAMTFQRLRPLGPERRGRKEGEVTNEIEGAFAALEAGQQGGGGEGEGGGKADAAVGRAERRAYELAEPGRPVADIVDLSRLGEFETSKALLTLVNQGYLAPAAPARDRPGAVGAYARDWQQRLRTLATRLVATLAIAGLLAGLAAWVDERGVAWGEGPGAAAVRDNAPQRFLARSQVARLRGALEVFRLEQGRYPDQLDELVGAGLASPRDLRYPWTEQYHYRRVPEGRFVLLPPVE
ncbi:MAG: DUF4388 domain-containing protein [Anaeromyxobacter sp.]|nr:DUF4388 domain-containing protein [Anaeromyxobacter sp.]MBL0278630.1 DUF4388 domain-containing protein [Anaeromyxobacter sp.]